MNAISGVLEAASKFKVEHTSPVLQHEFCQLWNQVVLKAQRDNDWMIASRVLRQLRKVYLTLHHNTNSVPTRFDTSPRGVLELESGYPVCRVVGHNHPNSVFTALAHTVIHDDAAQSPPSFPSLLSHPISTNATGLYHCLTTHTPPIRLLKAPAFPLPHLIKPLALVEYNTLSLQVT